MRKILDTAIVSAEKLKAKDFERGGFFDFERTSSVKEFGRNLILKGKTKKNKK